MRTLKLALAAVAAFAFNNAIAAGNQFNGMGGGYAGSATPVPAAGVYQ